MGPERIDPVDLALPGAIGGVRPAVLGPEERERERRRREEARRERERERGKPPSGPSVDADGHPHIDVRG
jgi:hypothetical protein